MSLTIRRHQIRAVGASVEKLMKPIFGARGFGASGVVTDWEQIVGPMLARATQPERIAYPQGERSQGTLHLRVANAPLALELQHLEPQMIERINSHFGYRAVARVRIVQGPISRKDKPKEAPPAAAPPERAAAVERSLAQVDDPALKAALKRLGEAVAGGPRRSGG